MAYTFTQLQEIKGRIVRDLSTQQNNLGTAKGAFAAIAANLGNMQTTYTGWATEVNAMAAANPLDPAIQALKAERDLMVAEFSSSKSEAETIDTTING